LKTKKNRASKGAVSIQKNRASKGAVSISARADQPSRIGT